MEPVNSYDQLAPLLSAQLKRGVVTNQFLSRGDWEAEWARGVRVHRTEGCLVLLRSRPTHDILNFYLHPGATLSLPQLTRPTVVELVWRQRDAEAVQQAAEQFLRQGFVQQLHRIRRQRDAEPVSFASAAEPAQVQQLPAVLELMTQSFDPRTGCIPSEAALAQDEVLCTWDGSRQIGRAHV